MTLPGRRLIAALAVAATFFLASGAPARAEDPQSSVMTAPVASIAHEAKGIPEFTAKADTKEGDTASDSEIRIEPVIWLPFVSANASIGDVRFANDRTANGVISPSDLKGKLHFAACGRIEGRTGRWGGFGELFYVNASAGTTFENFTGTFNTKFTLAQLAAFYRVYDGKTPVDVIAGARMISSTNRLDFNSARFPALGGQGMSVGKTRTDIDPIIGVRVSVPFSERFVGNLYGDYGGFGIGDNQQTWRVSANVGWNATRTFRMSLGYTAIGFSHQSGSGTTLVKSSAVMHGPAIGFSFKVL